MSNTIKMVHGPQATDTTNVRNSHCASPKRFYITRVDDQPVIRTLPITARRSADAASAQAAPSTTAPSTTYTPPEVAQQPDQRRKTSVVPRFVRAAVERATR